jgi:acyl-CoA synthetase (AMP-forming)/AMP-acid ligase II
MRNFKVALDVAEDCVILCATPVSHLGGIVAGVVFPAFLSARSVIMSGWRPDEAVEIIEQQGASLAMGATVFLSDLVQRYEAGAAAVERRSQWDGQVLAGMEIQAVSTDRVPLPAGTEGELRIRGPRLLTAYKDPERTRERIDSEGWFYPGDIGIVDDQGWIRMSGRLKDIINRGGEKFSALDIESAIASHPDVAAVAVTAVPDERLGEAVGAWIVLTPGTGWSGPERLVGHLETVRLARQKIPVRWTVVSSLPTTASGKVQKNKLAAWDRPS